MSKEIWLNVLSKFSLSNWIVSPCDFFPNSLFHRDSLIAIVEF